MSNKRKTFTAEFKTKVVLEVLKDNQTVAELSVKHGVTPKNINNWKTLFLENAEIAMDPSKSVSQYKKGFCRKLVSWVQYFQNQHPLDTVMQLLHKIDPIQSSYQH